MGHWANEAYENRGLLLLLIENAMGKTRHGSLLGLVWSVLCCRLKAQPKTDPGKIPEDETKERIP